MLEGGEACPGHLRGWGPCGDTGHVERAQTLVGVCPKAVALRSIPEGAVLRTMVSRCVE